MQEERNVLPSAEGCGINGFPAMCTSQSIKAWLQILACVVMNSVLSRSLEVFSAGPKILAPAPWKLGVLAYFGNGDTSVKQAKTGKTGERVSEARQD